MPARMIQAATLACALIALPACHSNRDEAGLGESFQLTPGESRLVEQYTVRFDSVTQDSRCPIDAVCVWQGSVELAITVRSGGTDVSYELGTFFHESTCEIAPGRVLQLLGVEPAARTTLGIPPEAYRVTLRVMPQV